MVSLIAFIIFSGFAWSQQVTRLDNEFHVQSIVLGNNPQNTANVVEGAGFDGLLLETPGAAEHLAALQAKNKKLYAIWRPLNQNWDGDLAAIQNAETHLVVHTSGYTNDDDVIRDLINLADRVQANGRMVLIYPHVNFHLEIGTEVLRVLEKMEANNNSRPNIGMVYTFAHTLNYHNNRDIDYKPIVLDVFQRGFKYIKAVSIAGSDSLSKNWTGIIQPLDQGNFDNFNVVKILLDMGYKGAFTLQAYGIPGDPNVFMGNSYNVWQVWQSQLMGLKGCADSNYVEYDSNVTIHDSSACLTVPVINEFPITPVKILNSSGYRVFIDEPHSITLRNIIGEIIFHNRSQSEEYDLKPLLTNGINLLEVKIDNIVYISKITPPL